jgi:hypothetical protein
MSRALNFSAALRRLECKRRILAASQMRSLLDVPLGNRLQRTCATRRLRRNLIALAEACERGLQQEPK